MSFATGCTLVHSLKYYTATEFYTEQLLGEQKTLLNDSGVSPEYYFLFMTKIT